MAANTIVMVLDADDQKRGEMHVLGTSHEAERLVESLLESGLPQDRLRVFSADLMQMTVVSKPIVSFTAQPAQPAGVSNGAAS